MKEIPEEGKVTEGSCGAASKGHLDIKVESHEKPTEEGGGGEKKI